MLRARHGAGERVAHAHGERGRRRLVFFHHVEMGVEGRDLVDFGQRKAHLLRQRGEMRGGEIAVAVLDQMEVLDQEIATARPVGQQCAHLVERSRVDLPAFRRLAWPVAPAQSSTVVDARVHLNALQNSPTMRPSLPTSIASAAGTFGRPGMVMTSPQIATTNSAPADSRTSRTVTM